MYDVVLYSSGLLLKTSFSPITHAIQSGGLHPYRHISGDRRQPRTMVTMKVCHASKLAKTVLVERLQPLELT